MLAMSAPPAARRLPLERRDALSSESTPGRGSEPGPAAARPRRVMAVASGGGHWVELRRLAAAFEGLDMVYVCAGAEPDLGPDPAPAAGGASPARRYAVRNVTRRDRLGFAPLAWQILRILARERPDAVVSTGAAPGLVALAAAKLLFRARTVWIDSAANAETLSLSGRLARPVADLRLVQWPHLARPGGPQYWGSVL